MHFIQGDLVAVDTETTGLDSWHGDAPFAIGFYNEYGETAYFEWAVDPYTRVVLPDEQELAKVKAFLEDRKVSKVFHNAKFDVRSLYNAFGIRVQGVIHDTMLMAHAVQSDEISLALKYLSQKYLDIGTEDQDELKEATKKLRREAEKRGWELGKTWSKDLEGKWKSTSNVEADYWIPRAFDPNDELCERYCLLDVERTMKLYQFYQYGMERYGVRHVYEKEQELWRVTYDMETRGVNISISKIDAEITRLRKEVRKAEKDIYSYNGGKPINLNSPKQLCVFLYETLGLPIEHYTDSGNPSADAKALISHMHHPAINAILRFRSAKNGLLNFFQKYKKLKVKEDNRWSLHPDFRQVGTVTGRFSCSMPNLQNVANAITTVSPVPLQARSPFCPRPGYIWYLIDYSQLEIRIFADVSQEPTMLQALEKKEDIHTACANKVWGGRDNPRSIQQAIRSLELVPGWGDGHAVADYWKKIGLSEKSVGKLRDRDKEQIARDWMDQFDYDIVAAETSLGKKAIRGKAKMVNFGKVFGGGPNAIKDLIGCSYREAQQIMDDYDTTFPHIVEYINDLSNEARRKGYIINRFGRRLEVNPDAPYRAVNYMVQGSAADLLKKGMIDSYEWLRENGYDAHIVMCIHDEVVFEVNQKIAKKPFARKLKELMEDHGGAFSIPTPADVDIVKVQWDQKTEVEL